MKNPYGVNKARGREIVAARKEEQRAKLVSEQPIVQPQSKAFGKLNARFRIVALTRDSDLGSLEIGATELQPGDYIEVEEA